MIDEKKLLEELIPILNEHGNMYLAGRIVGVINNQPKIGEWILYSERRPPDPEGEIPETREELENAFVSDSIKEYIVMLEGAVKPTTFFYGGDDRWCDPYGRLEPYRVIAWQPLPKPYKEGDIDD
ncbi:MAG: DUF551 domain-containing protein [Lachnospiraceae bacterium]|nr:DUF551 domain-containing protein [Lachnospiraceae bacterium]